MYPYVWVIVFVEELCEGPRHELALTTPHRSHLKCSKRFYSRQVVLSGIRSYGCKKPCNARVFDSYDPG